MRIVVRCNYQTQTSPTHELVANYVVGYLDGVNVKTRYIDENVVFTGIHFIINGQDIDGNDVVSMKIYDKCGWHDVKVEAGSIVLDVSMTFSYEDFATYIGNIQLHPQE